jgi:hypothetical protein
MQTNECRACDLSRTLFFGMVFLYTTIGFSIIFRARDANLEISIWKFVAGANQGNRCLSKHELSTEDDGEPFFRVNSTPLRLA